MYRKSFTERAAWVALASSPVKNQVPSRSTILSSSAYLVAFLVLAAFIWPDLKLVDARGPSCVHLPMIPTLN